MVEVGESRAALAGKGRCGTGMEPSLILPGHPLVFGEKHSASTIGESISEMLGGFLLHPLRGDIPSLLKLVGCQEQSMPWGRLTPACGPPASLAFAFRGWRRCGEVGKPPALQSFPSEASSLPGLKHRLQREPRWSCPGHPSPSAVPFLAPNWAEIAPRVVFWGEL